MIVNNAIIITIFLITYPMEKTIIIQNKRCNDDNDDDNDYLWSHKETFGKSQKQD
jgi:hypothetical protein